MNSETLVAILNSSSVSVVIGAAIALVATSVTEVVRARRESRYAARDARKLVHIDALRAMYAFRESARSFKNARLAEPFDGTDIEFKHREFVQAGIVFGEQSFLTMALGYRVVARTVDRLGDLISAWAFEGYPPFEQGLAISDPDLAGADREAAVSDLIGLLVGMVGEDSGQTRLTI